MPVLSPNTHCVWILPGTTLLCLFMPLPSPTIPLLGYQKEEMHVRILRRVLHPKLSASGQLGGAEDCPATPRLWLSWTPGMGIEESPVPAILSGHHYLPGPHADGPAPTLRRGFLRTPTRLFNRADSLLLVVP